MSQYDWLPDVRRAKHRADEAERAVDRLARLLVQALPTVAAANLALARRVRAEAVSVTRGAFPGAAHALLQVPLSQSTRSPFAHDSSEAPSSS